MMMNGIQVFTGSASRALLLSRPASFLDKLLLDRLLPVGHKPAPDDGRRTAILAGRDGDEDSAEETIIVD